MPTGLFQRGKMRSPNGPDEFEVAANREDVIAQYVSAGSVLDLGVVDSRRTHAPTGQRLAGFATSLHQRIRLLNPNVLGVDVDAEGIGILQRRGYNVLCADVETMALDRRFDTIVAGEIIEHLGNPRRALVSMRDHLKPSGRLILTTCNPFYINNFWKILKYNDIQVHEEHTAWFDPHTLGRLLNLSGFEVLRLCWIKAKRLHGRWRVLPARLRTYFHSNFLMVARPSQESGGRGQGSGARAWACNGEKADSCPLTPDS